MTRPAMAPALVAAALLTGGCGGGDGDEAAPVDSNDAADPDGPVDEVEPADDELSTDEPGAAPEAIDPATLEPGTAVVRVDGNEFRFARGDSIFDVCEFEPDFDLGQAKMDLVGGPEDGSPHLQIGYGGDKQIVVVAVPPDIAFIAGKGEETDPYFRHYGVVPPTAGPIDVVDGGASGRTTMMKVLADELVDASFAVRC